MKKSKSKSKSKSIAMNGGGIIGKGVSGTVYQPPIACDPVPIASLNTDEYVSKVFNDKSTFEDELSSMELLKTLDPSEQFTIQVKHTCIGPDGKPVMIMKYGGESMQTLLFSEKKGGVSTLDILNALIGLFPFIYSINERHIYHNDIHLDNILFNGRAYLIDWGISVTLNDAMKRTWRNINFGEVITPFYSFKRKELLSKIKEISYPYILESLKSVDIRALLSCFYEIATNPAVHWDNDRSPMIEFLEEIDARDDIVFEAFPLIFERLKKLILP